MADHEFPDDLFEAQRAFYAADVHVQEVTDALPSSLDIVAGTASISEDQRAALAEAREERLRIVDVLYSHPWWEAVDDQYAARLALQKAAKG